MKTLTAKEARILGLLVRYKCNWRKIAKQFSMNDADFKVAAEKAMATSYSIGKEQTKLAIDAAAKFLPN